MPGTASTQTSIRPTTASRPSAAYRPKTAAPLAPVLLRFPTIKQLGDIVPAIPAGPNEIAASAAIAIDPPVAAASASVGPASQSTPVVASQPAIVAQVKSPQARPWLEHWTSGVVLMILLLALVAAAAIALSDTQTGDAETVATETSSALARQSEGGIGSLSSIEVPEISLGTLSAGGVKPLPNDSVADSGEDAAANSSSRVPFAQVSARTTSSDSVQSGSKAVPKASIEPKLESSSASTIQLGLPAPIDSSSNSSPAFGPTSSSDLAPSSLLPPPTVTAPTGSLATETTRPSTNPPSTILLGSPTASSTSTSSGSDMKSLQLIPIPGTTANESPLGRVDVPKFPQLNWTPQASPPSIPASLVGFSQATPTLDAANQNPVTKQDTNASSAAVATPGASLSPPTQTAQPVAVTATPNSDIEQLAKMWQNFRRLHEATAPTDLSNRYSPALGTTSTPSNMPPLQPASNPAR